jgi:hypothetical protein
MADIIKYYKNLLKRERVKWEEWGLVAWNNVLMTLSVKRIVRDGGSVELY